MAKDTKDTLVTCRGTRCYRTAAGLCPGCGIPLCEACLERHAQYPGKAIQHRRAQSTDTEDSE